MEFGALICRPKKPSCEICALKKNCLSFKQKIVSNIPEPKIKINKKDLRCASFLAINKNSILVIKRKEKNILRKTIFLQYTQNFNKLSLFNFRKFNKNFIKSL